MIRHAGLVPALVCLAGHKFGVKTDVKARLL